jgi:prepilin-type N-terminal cleavage/methylation domain-containing protein
MPDKSPGFSLIELVMVMLIAAILSIFLITDFINAASSARLQAARFKLKSDIIYAQSLAVTQQINHGVIFNPASEVYSLYRRINSTNTSIISNPLTLSNFIVNYQTDSNFKGVNLVSTSFGSPTTDQVEFNSTGVPLSNATAALTVDGSVTLSYTGASAVIDVTKNTGKVN